MISYFILICSLMMLGGFYCIFGNQKSLQLRFALYSASFMFISLCYIRIYLVLDPIFWSRILILAYAVSLYCLYCLFEDLIPNYRSLFIKRWGFIGFFISILGLSFHPNCFLNFQLEPMKHVVYGWPFYIVLILLMSLFILLCVRAWWGLSMLAPEKRYVLKLLLVGMGGAFCLVCSLGTILPIFFDI